MNFKRFDPGYNWLRDPYVSEERFVSYGVVNIISFDFTKVKKCKLV